MARYLVTDGSHFTPLTYEEMVAPIKVADAAHEATQEAYDRMSMDAMALERYISQSNDPEAYKLYSNYVNKLTQLQNNLWDHGVGSQTRRDLSAARNAFASDIARVQNAVETRQARSKEYWDTKHNHPDMIMGDDPGKSSLDKYLEDPNYGSDYFTYSGNDFMNAVGKDAKARAQELLGNPEYRKNPALIGYIERIVREGYTSSEVRNASSAVRRALDGDTKATDNLSVAEGILANVLLAHLESTGASGKVSKDEFTRLFDYGRAGLSQAIGETKTDVLNDKEWDYLAKLAAEGQDGAGRPYTINSSSTYGESTTAKKNNENIKKNFMDPFTEGPIVYTTSDGQMDVIGNYIDAERILNSFGRQKIISTYGVPDPDNWLMRKPFTMPDGVTQARLDVLPYGENNMPQTVFQIKDTNGKWVTDDYYTKNYHKDERDYLKNKLEWSKNNPDIDLTELSIPYNKRKQMYEDNGIPENVPFEYVPYIMNTLSKQGYTTPAYIADPTMEDTLSNYAGLIISNFGKASGGKGKVSKKDAAAFYPISSSKYTAKEEGSGKLEDVFGTKKDGTINGDALTEISIHPEDVVAGKVRIQVGGTEYLISPTLLGNDIDTKISGMKDTVEYMMLPILDPSSSVMLSDTDAENWAANMQSILGNVMSFTGKNGAYISPKDIVKSPDLQGKLRSAVVAFMNSYVADARDNMNQNNMQVRSKTSTKPASYNPTIQ